MIFGGALLAFGAVGCADLVDPGDSRPWGGGGGYGGNRYPDYDRGYSIEEERAWEREQRRRADWERRQRDRDRDDRADQRADCAKLRNRIASDRAKLAEINPSKHHKAAQWYQDDLRNAERQLAACRTP